MSKKILYFLVLIVFTTFLFSTPINDLNIYPRIALVIGNNDYSKWGELNNPVKDATDMKNLLESRGFDVLYSTNIKRKKFEKLLIKFRNRLKKNPNSIGLFYFSGHGMEIEGSNYLVPIDSQSPERYENIELNKIINDMENSNNQLNIIILDACRDNPFINSFKSYNKGGFVKVKPPKGLLISYATQVGKVAIDGEKGENGLFTKYLLYYMQQSLDLYHVFKKTREAVDKESNHKQFPAIYDQTVGDDFYFTLPTSQTNIIKNISEIKIQKNNIESKLLQIVNDWVKVHNNQNLTILSKLYSNKVIYYKKKITRKECIKDKKRLFKKYPNFFQFVEEINYKEVTPTLYKVTFNKFVKFKNQVNMYPSYLLIDISLSSILVEGDDVTDGRCKVKKIIE